MAETGIFGRNSSFNQISVLAEFHLNSLNSVTAVSVKNLFRSHTINYVLPDGCLTTPEKNQAEYFFSLFLLPLFLSEFELYCVLNFSSRLGYVA